MTKQVMIVKPETLSAEHPFPGDVRIVTQVEEAEMGLVLKSFAEGLKKGGNPYAKECVTAALVENILANSINKGA